MFFAAKPVINPPSISVRSIPDDPPEFKREYSVKLINGITLNVVLRTFLGSRYDSSELDQRNGQWVLFDVHSPADKILDRELLPYVQSACREILREDAAFVASRPDQYTDEQGHIWKRVK